VEGVLIFVPHILFAISGFKKAAWNTENIITKISNITVKILLPDNTIATADEMISTVKMIREKKVNTNFVISVKKLEYTLLSTKDFTRALDIKIIKTRIAACTEEKVSLKSSIKTAQRGISLKRKAAVLEGEERIYSARLKYLLIFYRFL